MGGLFRRPYAIRRSEKQKIVKGYAVGTYSDFITELNVQPFSKNDLLALPEGSRSVARIKSFGSEPLMSADESGETPGDLIFYNEKWYECTSCVHWPHTPLSHYEAEFVLVADQAKHKPPAVPRKKRRRRD